MSDKFIAPAAKVGNIVHFYHGSTPGTLEQVPSPAIVTEVAPGGLLSLAILEKDNHAFKIPESFVRHADDPLAKRSLEIDPDLGVWVWPPDQLTPEEVAEVRILLAPPKNSVFGASPRPRDAA